MDAVKYKSLDYSYKLARFCLFLNKSYPFFGELCMRVEKYKRTTKSIAATDGYRIFLDEERINELPEESFNFLLLHELFHIILRHIYPKEALFYERMYWNIGYDLIANWLLMRMEYELRQNGLPIQPLSDSLISPDDLTGDPSHVIVSSFIKQAKNQGVLSDNPPPLVELSWKNFRTIVSTNDSYTFDVLGVSGSADSPSESEMKELLAASYKAAGEGGIPEYLRDLMDEIIVGRRLPWYLVLKRYLETAKEGADSDFCPPDKRLLYSGMVLPAEVEDGCALNNALIVLDVSSSVDRDELAKQLWQISVILSELDFDGTVLAFSDTVYEEYALRDKYSLKKFIDELQVGGGTNWQGVVSYVQSKKTIPKPIIVFTDGYFYGFEHKLANTIFITQGDYPSGLATLGTVIQANK